MTTARNTAYAENFFRRPYPNAAGNSINQGDFVYVDQTSFDVKAADTDAHCAYACGVADSTYPFLTEVTGPLYINVIERGDTVKYLKSGETFAPGDKCFIGANAQEVSRSGNYFVGLFADLPDASQKSVLGTGSNTGVVTIDCRWPRRIAYGLL